jgi:hypothetical protein
MSPVIGPPLLRPLLQTLDEVPLEQRLQWGEDLQTIPRLRVLHRLEV